MSPKTPPPEQERDWLGIVGAGPFGTALGNLVARAGRRVLVWSKDADVVSAINDTHTNPRLSGVSLSDRMHATDDPARFADTARFIVVAVSSTDVRARLHTLGDYLDGQHLVVHAIGALASPGDTLVSRVIVEETPALRIGALAGPALWRDLVEGTSASMVIASRFSEVIHEGRRLLSVPPALRLYTGKDLIGVELASALAGAYTLAVAVCDGLEMGPGLRATLITRAVAEASRLGKAAGADERTFAGLAGLGNLLVRTQTEHSSGYLAGRALARGDSSPTASEGVRAALAGVRLADRLGVRVPVLSAVAAVLSGTMSPRAAAAAAADTVADEE